jgi:hypothetical protein
MKDKSKDPNYFTIRVPTEIKEEFYELLEIALNNIDEADLNKSEKECFKFVKKLVGI